VFDRKNDHYYNQKINTTTTYDDSIQRDWTYISNDDHDDNKHFYHKNTHYFNNYTRRYEHYHTGPWSYKTHTSGHEPLDNNSHRVNDNLDNHNTDGNGNTFHHYHRWYHYKTLNIYDIHHVTINSVFDIMDDEHTDIPLTYIVG
jgi:hypothetical protein